ncbi:hypothetical protein G3I20_18755 [Streptomyces sp. SID8111]|uniref:hypothetical protein n=1 Tax=Streptomyces sp. SID8111 TaxID=2706100 RepID=UPI0013C10504|nr:hypothetical protein [Streptomyces sp. SID8111]NEB59729.1 hypothetical protein [Streptomyces diastaticus]NEC28557.1 hypothetical protein [Streptomyces sp. SID8111]
MTQDPDSYAREAAALERLTRRHGGEHYRRLNSHGGPYLTATPLEAVMLVAKALDHDGGGRVTGQDLEDAILLLDRARGELDLHELELVDHARLHHGRTWGQVAEAAGAGRDRRIAQTRYSRLRGRVPGYTPPVTPQGAAGA